MQQRAPPHVSAYSRTYTLRTCAIKRISRRPRGKKIEGHEKKKDTQKNKESVGDLADGFFNCMLRIRARLVGRVRGVSAYLRTYQAQALKDAVKDAVGHLYSRRTRLLCVVSGLVLQDCSLR
jgi:hypothetical protein